MSPKKSALSVTAVVVVTLVLFDIDIDLQFSLPKDVETLDVEQESRFDYCVAERDRVIHAETFSTIDNPNVQLEILTARKEVAVRECRSIFPQRPVTTRESFRFNIIDMKFRY